ncbi:blast:Trichohyalin [Drosophila guanche]|uniref:Blast:Trichohyalin n=1 Tax=Drosophila guanche TaxID=7266 RepID=A0A3B0J4B7_DROGU|nr:blast:Trichohyalin [Drosophila guanche]
MCRNRLCLQLQRFLGRFRSFPSVCKDPAPPAPWHRVEMSELRSSMPSISERELEPPMACDILNSELNKADRRQWPSFDAETSCRFRCFPKLPQTNCRSLQERNEGLCLEMRAMEGRNSALWLKEPVQQEQVLGQLERLPKYSCKDFVSVSEASMKPELTPKTETAAPFCLHTSAPSIPEAMRKREEKLLESIKRKTTSHWSQQKERLPSRQFEEDFDNLRRWQKRQSTSRLKAKAKETEEDCSPTSRESKANRRHQKQRKTLKSKDIPEEQATQELGELQESLNHLQLKMILEMRNKSNSKQNKLEKDDNRLTDSDSDGCDAYRCATFKDAERKKKDAAIQRMLLLSDLKQKRGEIVAKQQLLRDKSRALREKSRQTQAEDKQQPREVKRMVRHRRPSASQCTRSSHSLMVTPAISKWRKAEVPRGLEDAFGDAFPERLDDGSKLLGKTHPTQPQQPQQPWNPVQIGSTIILRKCLSNLKEYGINADALVVYWLRQAAFPPDRGTKKGSFIIDETSTSTSMSSMTLWPSSTKDEKTPSDVGSQ